MSSDLAFFPELQADWRRVPLKGVCDYRVSNVDKVPSDDEQPVRLCNYVDVYHNEFITPNLKLMNATATEAEIDRFGLGVGDVIITKDSESWDDIGVPAVVAESAPDIVCGYHLAMLRPMAGVLDGRYLFRCLQARPMQYQFERAVSGVTRYGLGLDTIGRLILPLPPYAVQTAIADYLDRETATIDAMIAAKERLLKLLAEKRRALITHAVTRGLNPDAPMRDSGVAWLGEIPEHWEVHRLAYQFRDRDERNHPELPLLVVSLKRGVVLREFSEDKIEGTAADFGSYKVARKDDIAFNKMRMWQGAVGSTPQDGLVSPDYVVAEPIGSLRPDFAELLFRTPAFSAECARHSQGIVWDRLRLYWDGFKNIQVAIPPAGEQEDIGEEICRRTEEFDRFILHATESMRLLAERRSSLIAAAVTGEIDVEATV